MGEEERKVDYKENQMEYEKGYVYSLMDKGERYYNRTDEQLVQFAAWKPEFEKE